MIHNIVEHKIRNGTLIFFGGLFMVIAALYMDAFQGKVQDTMDLYQITGAITGYIVSATGGVLIVKETRIRQTIQSILIYGGAIIVSISMFADFLNVYGPSGFDKFQIIGSLLGLTILTLGIMVLPKKLLNTLRYISTGNVASFKWRGTQFILTYTQNSNQVSYDVYVDGSKISTIQATGKFQWQATYISPIFPLGAHKAELKNTSGFGNIIDVVNIQTLETSMPRKGIYDDTHFNWSYTGSWEISRYNGAFNGSIHYTRDIGSVASFRFNGTKFILIYTQDINRANYDVYVDGEKIDTIYANGFFQWQQTYVSPVFTTGVHIVEFRNTGGLGNIMDVDAIEIL